MSDQSRHCDAVLEARLRDVPVPRGLIERLRRIAGPPTDESDDALRDVPVPAGLLERLRRTAVRPSRARWRRFAMAAVLMFALWIAYAGVLVAAVGMFSAHPPSLPDPEGEAWQVGRLPPPRLTPRDVEQGAFPSRLPPRRLPGAPDRGPNSW